MMFYGWTALVGFWLGATFGSFLNVVIYRTPRGLSIAKPKNSFCPACKRQLAIADLVPLLSWLYLRGRCRQCGAKVSARYFVVELLNGLIWAGIWWQYLVVGSSPATAIAYAAAASALVAIIFIDWEFYIIPDQVNAFLVAVGVGLNIYLYATHDPRASTWGIPSALAGGLAGEGTLWLIAFLGRLAFRKDAMGHGDIKMARGIGAVLFPTAALISFAIAVVLGAVLGLVQVIVRNAAERSAELAALEPEAPESELQDEPESIGSLLKSGLGYLLCLDLIGLVYPKLYIAWFGEDPYEPVVGPEGEQDDWEAGRTMIPFGPYLALGAIVASVFEAQLRGGFDAYWKWAAGAHAG